MRSEAEAAGSCGAIPSLIPSHPLGNASLPQLPLLGVLSCSAKNQGPEEFLQFHNWRSRTGTGLPSAHECSQACTTTSSLLQMSAPHRRPLPHPAPLQAPVVGAGSPLPHRGVPAWRTRWGVHGLWEKAASASSSPIYMGQLSMGLPEMLLLQGTLWYPALHAHACRVCRLGAVPRDVETSCGHDPW